MIPPQKIYPGNSKKGFSLLELLISFFLLFIIVAGSLLLLHTAGRTWFQGESETSVQIEARNLISFLDQLISATVLITNNENNQLDFLGYPDRVSFCTLLLENEERTDFARIDVFWKKEEATIYIREERAETGNKIFSESGKSGSQLLADGITKFNLSYFDGREEHKTWNNGKGGPEEDTLPKAVFLDFQVSGQKSEEGRIFQRDYHAVFEIKNN